ncbi:ribonuclease H-like domain-containing protein [Tanacetum coccineum]
MRMKQYLTHNDYTLWEIIVNGNAPVTTTAASASGEVPPKTVAQVLQRKNELKAKSTLLLAISYEHLLKFHGIQDAKSLWEAIKTRFRGSKESKKMFQKLVSQLEIHSENISLEDINLKLLRSLPSAWNTHSLVIRNKGDLDTVTTDDLYNNLKVYEAEIKGQSSLSSNSQNMAFISSENLNSTNEAVNTAYSVTTASAQDQPSTLTYVDDIDADDLEEMDIKWQVAMLTMRVKNFIKKTGRNLKFNGKETVGFDKTNVECFNCHRRGHFARECRAPRTQGYRNIDNINAQRNAPVDTSNSIALIVQDGVGGYDWSFQAEEVPTNFALMAYSSPGSSSSSSSDTKARIVVHQKNEAVYEESIEFLKYDVRERDALIKQLKNQLEEALKEKDDLKLLETKKSRSLVVI